MDSTGYNYINYALKWLVVVCMFLYENYYIQYVHYSTSQHIIDHLPRLDSCCCLILGGVVAFLSYFMVLAFIQFSSALELSDLKFFFIL